MTTTTQTGPTEVPREMKAATIDRFGGPDVVHTATVPVPKLEPHEVLIRVEVAGVGVWDPSLVRGEFSDGHKGFPQIHGSDGAGTIVAVGEDVKRFKPGDEVYGFGFGNVKGGFYAEYCAIDAARVAPVPKNLSLEEAGGLAVCGLTALEGLEELDLKEGSTVLIVGASGGVGHIAIQLAKRMGARVVAVASGRDGVELAKRCGADEVIEGKKHDVANTAEKLSRDGFDGALVLAGRSDGWKGALALVKKGGHVAYPNGVEPAPATRKRVTLTAYDGESAPDAFARLNKLIEQAPFHVELSRTYSIDDAALALKEVNEHHIGKLALRIH